MPASAKIVKKAARVNAAVHLEVMEMRLLFSQLWAIPTRDFPSPKTPDTGVVFGPDGVPQAPFLGGPVGEPDDADDGDEGQPPVLVPPIIPQATFTLSSSSWTPVGPGPINSGQVPGGGPVSGRITSIVASPTDANTVLIGAADGGIWKSTNATAATPTWTPMTDAQSSLAIGAMAIAPSNSSIIYAGTGEANNSQDSLYGAGVLKSTDGGATWTLLANATFNRLAVSKMAVDPTNANTVYMAIGDFAENGVGGNTGIWKSIDGGTTWTNTTVSLSSNHSDPWSDIIIDPNNSQILYAACGDYAGDPFGSGLNGVYKSLNGGTNWTKLTFGTASTVGVIKLAAAKVGVNTTLYASASGTGNAGSTSFGTLDLFEKSTDAGATWTNETSTTPNYMGSQGWYDSLLITDAADATGNTVYAAGSAGTNSVIRSVNGGTSWTDINTGTAGNNGPHADHHAFTFDAAGKLLDGDDGGIWRLTSPTGTITWADLNGNLQITQFQAVTINPTNFNIVLGGSQDNGTSATSGTTNWTLREGGDGGNVVISPSNTSVVYHIAPVGSFGTSSFFRRSNDGGVTWASKVSGIPTADANAMNFYPPFAVDGGDGTHLVIGSTRVFQSNNSADNWTAISVALNGTNPIDSLAIGQADHNTIYASSAGHVYVTTNANLGASSTWAEHSPATLSHIAQILVDPSNSQIAYAVHDAFSVPHVYRTINGGGTWTDISGNLPNFPTYSIALTGTGASAVLYVGTDKGVYQSSNLGTSWALFGTGLPNSSVFSLQINQQQVIVAGTHGRGAFELQLAAPLVLTGANVYLRESSDHLSLDVWVNSATPGVNPTTESLPLGSITTVSVTGTASNNDVLTVDYANGDPFPSTVSYDGLAGTGDLLTVMFGSPGGTMTVDGAAVTFGSTPISYANTESIQITGIGGNDTLIQSAQPNANLSFAGGTGTDTLTINGGTYKLIGDPSATTASLTVNDNANLTFAAATPGTLVNARHLTALNLGASATATAASAVSHSDRAVLILGALSLNATALLDLNDNDMIVQNGNLSDAHQADHAGENLSGTPWTGTSRHHLHSGDRFAASLCAGRYSKQGSQRQSDLRSDHGLWPVRRSKPGHQ